MKEICVHTALHKAVAKTPGRKLSVFLKNLNIYEYIYKDVIFIYNIFDIFIFIYTYKTW